jgi:GST-like protein
VSTEHETYCFTGERFARFVSPDFLASSGAVSADEMLLADQRGQVQRFQFEPPDQDPFEIDEAGADDMAWDDGSGFVEVNPNSKIPALLDCSGASPVRVFESGAILMYLAEKFGAFLPTEPAARAECLSWLFWQMGSAPFLGGGFGHFYAYAPEKIEYAINRYAMETKRQLDVLNRRLAEVPYVSGDEYTVADIAIWPWYGATAKGQTYGAGEFLQVHEYTHVIAWADRIAQRPAVRRGRIVNRMQGDASQQLRERHDASDFELRTEDKLNKPA